MGLNESKKDADKNFSSKPVDSCTEDCPLANLLVTVIRPSKKGDPNFNNTITIQKTGDAPKTATEKCDSEKSFKKIPPGQYTISAKPEDGNGYSFEKSVKVSLSEGQTKKVKVKLVKLEIVKVTPTKNCKQYINLAKDAAKVDYGRIRKVEAHLNKKKADVTVYFDIKAGDKNRDPLPAALQAKITKSSKTNDKGIAEVEFESSRFGGDEFTIMASLHEDVKHVSSNAKKSKKITNWRKIWYQITQDKGVNIPSRSKVKKSFKDTFLEVEETDNKKLVYKDDIAGLQYHPIWQFEPGKGNRQIVCVGNHNKTEFYKEFVAATADKAPKAHLIICEAQWDPEDSPETTFELDKSTKAFRQLNSTNNDVLGVFDPPLKGGTLVKSGSWKWHDGTVEHTGELNDANISVYKSRALYSDFKLTIPSKCTIGVCTGCAGNTNILPTVAKKATAKLIMQCANGPWAGESGNKALNRPQCLIIVDKNTNVFNGTIIHELGHLHEQVRVDKNWLGIPDHTDQYDFRGGSGDHCKKDATEHATDVDQNGKKVYVGGSCVMYHVAVGNTKFCDQCKLDLKIRDLSDFFK